MKCQFKRMRACRSGRPRQGTFYRDICRSDREVRGTDNRAGYVFRSKYAASAPEFLGIRRGNREDLAEG